MIDDQPAPGVPTIAAFTSSTNGIGRTEVVANLAWVLAASGHRVAVADWGTEAPRVHGFLEPFHVRTLEVAELLDEVLEPSPVNSPARRQLLDLFDAVASQTPLARRYELPRGLGRVDVLASDDPSTPDLGQVETLREGIRRLSYDYVLIDSSTNLSPEAANWMTRLCDVVAVCFEPMRSSISQAAGFAHNVWDFAPVGVRLIAVPVQLDRSDPERAKRADSAIASAFGRLMAPEDDPFGRTMSGELVAIPAHRGESIVETLAVIMDDSGQQVDAYSELATAVAHRELRNGMSTRWELPEDVRERYRRSVGLSPTRVALDYAHQDRPWADWVRSQLARAGAEVASSSQPGDSLVRINSRHSPSERDHFDGHLVVVTVDSTTPPDDGEHVSLVGVAEPTARDRLLEAFSLVPGVAADVRFPADVDKQLRQRRRRNLPRRLDSFSGRGVELEAMRDALSDTSVLRTWWVTGPEGIGKTELAKEYAHRFGFDYEYVWWIPAHDRHAITEKLADLGRVLGIPMEGRVTEAVLDRLAYAIPSQRWLLVYDAADDPRVLRGLVPRQGCGHVVITSRAQADDKAVTP